MVFSFMEQMSPEERAYRDKCYALYDYYGLPDAIFDENNRRKLNDYEKQRNRDWLEASLLIDSNQEIPDDLKVRLLKYKEELRYKKN